MNNDDKKNFGQVFKKMGFDSADQTSSGGNPGETDSKEAGLIFEKMGITGSEYPVADGSAETNGLVENKNDGIFNSTTQDSSDAGGLLSSKSSRAEIFNVDRTVEKIVEVPVDRVVAVSYTHLTLPTKA